MPRCVTENFNKEWQRHYTDKVNFNLFYSKVIIIPVNIPFGHSPPVEGVYSFSGTSSADHLSDSLKTSRGSTTEGTKSSRVESKDI